MSTSTASTLYDLLFRSESGIVLFSDRSAVQFMLDFEAALAQAEAKFDVIPTDAAAAISLCCKADQIDFEGLAEGVAISGNPAIPLVKQLTSLVAANSPQAAGFVHWGVTSQDVMDSALMMQLTKHFGLVEVLLGNCCDLLAQLVERHQNTPMVGRTWMQHAVPVTFGLKAAGWLDALMRHQGRLVEMRSRVLRLQFGGAAGTLAAIGPKAHQVAAAVAEALHLPLPAMPWHSERDGIAEVAAFHGLVCGTLGKMARDFSLLMQTEVGELAETAKADRGGSSSMPHKRNPVATASILATSMRMPGLVAILLTASVQEHERGLGGWHAEWETLPEICILTLGALENMGLILTGMRVSPDRMRANMDLTRGLIMAESVSSALARHIGRDKAHTLLERNSRAVFASGQDLRHCLESDVEITQYLSAAELDQLLDPVQYVGEASYFCNSVLDAYQTATKLAQGSV